MIETVYQRVAVDKQYVGSFKEDTERDQKCEEEARIFQF